MPDDLEPELETFKGWLEAQNCYVFTINGFPYGSFHGTRVKEQVYCPDWREESRVAYTKQLFRMLVQLLPDGIAGSVSTVPLSFKPFLTLDDELSACIAHLHDMARFLAELSASCGHELHLGLEPEPLCTIETSAEAIAFFERLHQGADAELSAQISRHIGINYDTCHLAVEYEEAATALAALQAAGIRISKLHLSSALRLPNPAEHAELLAPFVEPTYLHQVVMAEQGQVRRRVADLDLALAEHQRDPHGCGDEWRVHFHVPLHAAPELPVMDTRDQLLAALEWLGENPGACHHLEMETYTWGVLPSAIKAGDVVDQLAREYEWTLMALGQTGFAH